MHFRNDFDNAAQEMFMEGIAAAAGVDPSKVEILEIMVATRRQSASIIIDLTVVLQGLAAAGNLNNDNINKELVKRGLPAGTVLLSDGISLVPVKSVSGTPQPAESTPTAQKNVIIGVASGLGALVLATAAISWMYFQRKYKNQDKRLKRLWRVREDRLQEPLQVSFFSAEADQLEAPVLRGDFFSLTDDNLPGASSRPASVARLSLVEYFHDVAELPRQQVQEIEYQMVLSRTLKERSEQLAASADVGAVSSSPARLPIDRHMSPISPNMAVSQAVLLEKVTDNAVTSPTQTRWCTTHLDMQLVHRKYLVLNQ